MSKQMPEELEFNITVWPVYYTAEHAKICSICERGAIILLVESRINRFL